MRLLSRARKIFAKEKGLAYITIGNLIASLIGAAIWLILASILTAEDYGRINYYVAIGFIGGLTSLLGLNTTTTTFIAKGQYRIHSEASMLLLLIVTGTTITIFILTGSLPAALVLLGVAFSTMYSAKLLGEKAYKKYVIVIIGQRITQSVLIIPMHMLLGSDGIIIALGIGWFAFGVPFLLSIRFIRTFKEIRSQLKFMLHSYSMELVRSINLYLDKLIIAPLFGFAVLGNYQFSTQFFYFLVIMGPQTFYSYLLPQEASGEKKRTIRILGIGFSVGLVVLSWLASPYIVTSLFPTFSDSIPIIQIMSTGVVPLTFSSIIGASLLATGDTRPIFFASMIFLVVELTLLLTIGSVLGILGLAISYVSALGSEAIFLIFAKYLKHRKTV